MGQQQSQQKITEKAPELLSLEQEIQRLRQDLQELKQDGQDKRRRYREELKQPVSDFNSSLLRFHACDRTATSLFHFWDYLEIIKQEVDQEQQQDTTSQAPKVQSQPSPSVVAASPPNTHSTSKDKPSITTLSKTSLSTISTQFSINIIRLFQAHLLRKLHMGLMLTTQSKKQAKGWNKLILFYYNRAQDKVGTRFRKANAHAAKVLKQGKVHQQEKQDLISRILNLQQELLDRLQAAMPRRSSIKDIRQSKRELEMLRYVISPYAAPQGKQTVDVTILQTVPKVPSTDSEESKEDREEQPEMDELHTTSRKMPRRSSIEDIKAKTRELDLLRSKSASPTSNIDIEEEQPTIVAI
ncbi:MAG: hypothetical protein SGBAC_007944 [Bacillariaceae sp.]